MARFIPRNIEESLKSKTIEHRRKNRTVFLDINTKKIYEDQWLYLSSVKKATKEQIYSFAPVLSAKNIQKDLKHINFPINSFEVVLNSGIEIPMKNLSKSFISK